MDTLGKHLLAEYYGCDRGLLNDAPALSRLLKRAAAAAGVSVVGSIEHRFSPHGVTCVVAIEESHLSLHTWPEAGYAAADFFTCGEGLPNQAHQVLLEGLGAGRTEVMLVHRGNAGGERSIEVMSHLSQERQPERTFPALP
jgi:S-adenosylmethionine decarboxylase